MNKKTHVGSTEASFMLGLSEARVRRLLGYRWRIGGHTPYSNQPTTFGFSVSYSTDDLREFRLVPGAKL
ncbi:MAG: hypothetical protein F6J86_34140, partial [Symploca sp. SIO1B1]|nr:hypothetical protein [Symploca sp. SIO1B1]